MFSKSAQYYDILYSTFKDYNEECANIQSLLTELFPQARTVLDVGCGSGEHARILNEEFGYAVDGIDIEPEFVRISQQKCPHGKFYAKNMADFDVDCKYDVVLCLFSSIAYVKTRENVIKTLLCFNKHISANGVILVEPWFTPDKWQKDRVSILTSSNDKISVCRMSHNTIAGRISRMNFHYLIGQESGIDHFEEIHELGLFTHEEMLECFNKANLVVNFRPQGFSVKGLYIARKKSITWSSTNNIIRNHF